MKKRAGIIVITTLLMLIASFLTADLATAGDGDGDGSGGGKNNPLAIVSSMPANGSAGVENLEYIKLTFSKNVVYMTVRESNKQCFSLWKGTEKIPAEIIMADDQIEREKRNDVLIKPLQALQAGTTYQVEVAPQLESKSGVTLGEKAVISFTMAGKSATEASASDDKADDSLLTANEPEVTADTINDETELNQTDADIKADESEKDSAEQEAGNVIKKAAEDEQDQTAGQNKESKDEMSSIKTAGMWIVIVGLAVLAVRFGYRKLNKK
ncbi:MAG TPA: Ig-like domain-containing protein [Syntrophomonadaceae bacterium]|nr:Ig-like domain-containing protein [Syntrophomonadaceae bacterium]HPR93558.1 Ig-like domain-containing protein [Syntrophomonadaceae bacterium]